jgi:hypothetical protein
MTNPDRNAAQRLLWRLAERAGLLTLAEREWLREALGASLLSVRQIQRAQELLDRTERRRALDNHQP